MPDLSAARLTDQARKLHGEPYPGLALGRDGLFTGPMGLPIPGWPLGVWKVVDGKVGPLIPHPEGSFRTLWLAETGHLVFAMVDSGVLSDASRVIVADTAGDFFRHAVPTLEVGQRVWDDATVRLPMLQQHTGEPLQGWTAGGDPTLRGGHALLLDPPTRRLNEDIAAAVREVALADGADPQGAVLSWEGVAIGGVWAYTASSHNVRLDDGRSLDFKPPVFVAGVALTNTGQWLAVHSVDFDESGFTGLNLRFFDTVGDFYRQCAAQGNNFPQMEEAWAFLRRRYSLLQRCEAGALARWR